MYLEAFMVGLAGYLIYRIILGGFYTVKPDERAVITSLGRAVRLGGEMPVDDSLDAEERERYRFPRLRVIGPGGPYFKWPWQKVHKVSVATQAVDLAWDPTKRQSDDRGGDQGQPDHRGERADPLPGQREQPLRLPVRRGQPAGARDGLLRLGAARADRQLRRPARGRAWWHDDGARSEESATAVELSEGVSINDLRKNLPLLNDVHGAAVPFHRRPLRHRAGRRPDHRDRSAAGSGPRPVGHQQHPQPGGGGHQHGPGRLGAADHHEQACGGDRHEQRPGRGGPAAGTGRHAGARSRRRAAPRRSTAYLRNMRVPLLGRARRIVQTHRVHA